MAKRPLRSGPGSQFVWSLFPKIRCLRDKNSLENIFGIKEDKGRIPNVMEIRTRKPSAVKIIKKQALQEKIQCKRHRRCKQELKDVCGCWFQDSLSSK